MSNNLGGGGAVTNDPVRIFRTCLNRYWRCKDSIRLTRHGCKDLEFCADFEKLADEYLTAQQLRYFKSCILQELGPNRFAAMEQLDKLDSRLLQVSVLERLGEVYRDQVPYPLYPCDQYFQSPRRAAIA